MSRLSSGRPRVIHYLLEACGRTLMHEEHRDTTLLLCDDVLLKVKRPTVNLHIG